MTKFKQAAFGAQLMCLPEIFDGRVFAVPDYQRAYAWDDKQVQELLKDLDHLLDDGASHCHYTGTLVLSKAGMSDFGDEYQVVDGQQRLTTLAILLRLIADHLPLEERHEFDELYLRRGSVGSERLVLSLNSDTQHFFSRVVMGNGNADEEPSTLEAHDRLLKARRSIAAWIEARIENGTTLLCLRNTIEHELGFLVYAPAEDAETGIMFEVINNRGKALSELEKVKNYLIYCCVKLNARALRKGVDENWSDILRHLNVAKKTSPGDEGAFLRYCMVVFFRLSKTDSQNGYDELKKRMDLDATLRQPSAKEGVIQQIASFVDFMKRAALWYSRLYGRQYVGMDDSLKPVLEQLRGQDRHASIMPLFLALVMREKFDCPTVNRLLCLLERVNFRVYMARSITARNDTGQAELYSLAASYYHGELLTSIPEDERSLRAVTLGGDVDALEYRLVEFGMGHSPDSKFLASFILEADSNDDFYRWGGLRYFLMNYEQLLQPHKTIQLDKITMARSEGKSADYLSVEHRWAIEHRNVQGENNRPIDFFEKRRLGNFVLLELRLNIQASNASLEDKLARYLGKEDEPATDLEQVRRMAREATAALKAMKDWTKSKNYHLELQRAISDNIEQKLIDFAAKRWSLKDYVGYADVIRRAELDYEEM